MLLTGDAAPAHECLALDKGAIDVILKSRGSDVLARRLKSVVKTSGRTDQPRSGGPMKCGKLLLRPDIGRAYWKDVDVGLTLGEYNIVHLLASNAGRYVTFRAIYDRLHYEGFIAGGGADGYRANVRSVDQAYPEQVPQLRPDLRRDRELQRLRVLLEEARLNRLVARPWSRAPSSVAIARRPRRWSGAGRSQDAVLRGMLKSDSQQSVMPITALTEAAPHSGTGDELCGA